MYSPRQRDVRERRIHQRIDEQWAAIEIVATDTDDATEIEPQASWAMPLSARPSAA